MNILSSADKIASGPASNRLKQMGLVGFSFFFIKGLLWLLIPILAHSALFN
jgi:hypothetical protein